MRLIDADALKKDLTRFYDNEVTAKRLIDEQPTIEPQRTNGRWIDTGRALRWECSNCGRRDNHIYNYCPNCGADMRGDEK